jgi:maleate isomerase
MSSWRARIGKISPSRGDTYMYEFYQIVPKNILLTQIATKVKKLTPDNFSQAFDAYEEAALTLAEEGAQTLIFGGGPVFVSQGPGSEELLRARIEKATSLSMTTEFSSTSDACHALGIKRLGIISPYREGLNGLIKAYFEAKGFEVPLIRGLGIERNIDIGNLPEDAPFQLTMQAFREGPEVDGFYITCSRWRGAANITPLEKETGKPVVTSTQTTIWSAFKSLGIKDRISGFGTLLSSHHD